MHLLPGRASSLLCFACFPSFVVFSSVIHCDSGYKLKKIHSWQEYQSLAHQGQDKKIWWTECTTSLIQPSNNSGFLWFHQDFIDDRVKQLTGAIHAASLPSFLLLCAVCTTPTPWILALLLSLPKQDSDSEPLAGASTGSDFSLHFA